ncbi:Holliday junction branch migration protein RuvA [Desulfuromonas thiophila]|uniref:Holliday junction branch migration protein RuvA n=1 Tax=Desulfuromonas thiophila TaxID=57664 RepID=UPI0024A979A5|nr:Holliday junction branch migration protein RuvA [Desulfuromonas thiophila]
MIARLSGLLCHKEPEQLIIDVQGVGYRVFVPLSSFYELPDTGQPVQLHIHTLVREDALLLYGFSSLLQKQLFLLLLGISGIGPKVALNILSHLSCDELQQALLLQNSVRLSLVPGIGKKTAERLVLELHEKVQKLSAAAAAASGRSAATTAGRSDTDVLSALLSLGYKEKEARAALGRIEGAAGLSTEALLRAALQELTPGRN